MIATKFHRLLAGLILAVFTALPAGAEPDTARLTEGSWTLRPSESPGKVQVTFVYGRSVQSTDWTASDLRGLHLTPAEKHDARFVLDRDAGRIEGDGVSASGTAAGSFRFTPEPNYAAEMRKLGLGEIKQDALLSFALHDISLGFAREMAALTISNLSIDELLAFRIHGVTPDYVKGLRAAGSQPSADELIAFRIHGVTPDYVTAIRKLGYDTPAPGQLIAMRIHGVTPDYIASVKSKGVRDTSLNQLIAMKIQGID